MAKKVKTRLGTDGYDYPYTHEDLVFDNDGVSVGQKYATKDYVDSKLNGLRIVQLTLEEYNDLDTKEDDVLYIIV